MDFLIDLEASRIYDLINYPEIVKDIDQDTYRNIKEEIDFFYSKIIYGKYSLKDSFIRFMPILKFKKEEELIDYIKALSVKEFAVGLFESVLYFDNLLEEYPVDFQNKDLNHIIDSIYRTRIESTLKFDLISCLQEGEDILVRFSRLIKEISPSFENYYSPYYDSLREEAKDYKNLRLKKDKIGEEDIVSYLVTTIARKKPKIIYNLAGPIYILGINN